MLAPNVSIWNRVSTGGAPGSTHFSTGDAIPTIVHPAREDSAANALDLVVAQVDDVLAVDHAKLDAVQADRRHRVQRHVEVARKFVGDCATPGGS